MQQVDVETFEVHVVNGAMHFLCSRIVHLIAMEVEYVKGKACNAQKMQTVLETLGFAVYDTANTPRTHARTRARAHANG